MRFPIALAAMTLLAVQAHAQTATTPAAPVAPAPSAAAPSPTTPSDTATPTRHARPRVTLQQRFEQANTTHDGQLTLEQAKAGMPMVAKHFDAIDKEKKGYVTVEQVQAYAAARRAEHRGSHHSGSSS